MIDTPASITAHDSCRSSKALSQNGPSCTAIALQAAAIEYMTKGWHPIPITPPVPGNKNTGKVPAIRKWQEHLASEKDLPLYREGMNIGVSCGPSRLVVLDFDCQDAFFVWAKAHPDAVNTFTVARDNAPAGRCHLYFQLGEEQNPPAQLTKTATGWGDLKSVGGQVVAPPSIHYTGGRYTVVRDTVPLPWRPEYVPVIYSPGLPPKNAPISNPHDQPANQDRGMPLSVKAALDAGASEGNRNQTAFFIATQLRDEGWPAAEAKRVLDEFAARCSPPMAPREVQTVVDSAFQKPPRDPAACPKGTGFFGPRHDSRIGDRTLEQAASEPWPTPLPLGALSEQPPPWPWESYPKPLADLGKAMVATMNVPDELPGLALLCACSIACRKVAHVEIKRDHHQFANLYGMAALNVASSKSPVCRVIQRPLLKFQKAIREKYSEAMSKWAAAWTAARAEIAKYEKMLSKGDGDPVALTAEIAKLQAVESNKPCEPVLLVNDATSEAMARIMSHNGGCLGVFSSEARNVLAIARGRYVAQGADIQLWLAGHGGDFLRYDRNSADKPPFEIHEPVLSAFLATQKDSLQTLGKSAELRESGFLARWLYVMPGSAGSGDYPTESIEPRILDDYYSTMAILLDVAPATNADGEACPHNVPLDYRAFGAWKDFHDTTKREAMGAPPLLAGCLNKMPEHCARIALAFHLYSLAIAGNSVTATITPAEMARAIALSRVLLVHIRRSCEIMGESQERVAARELWPVLNNHRAKLADEREREGLGRIVAVKPRDVARYGWAGINDCEDARTILLELELKGWLRSCVAPAKVRYAAHELFMLYPDNG